MSLHQWGAIAQQFPCCEYIEVNGFRITAETAHKCWPETKRSWGPKPKDVSDTYNFAFIVFKPYIDEDKAEGATEKAQVHMHVPKAVADWLGGPASETDTGGHAERAATDGETTQLEFSFRVHTNEKWLQKQKERDVLHSAVLRAVGDQIASPGNGGYAQFYSYDDPEDKRQHWPTLMLVYSGPQDWTVSPDEERYKSASEPVRFR